MGWTEEFEAVRNSLNGRVSLGFHWFQRLKAGVVDPVVLNIDKRIPNEQPSTNVDSFKQESATILSFDTGPVNEWKMPCTVSLSASPRVQFTRKRVAIKESGCWIFGLNRFRPTPYSKYWWEGKSAPALYPNSTRMAIHLLVCCCPQPTWSSQSGCPH